MKKPMDLDARPYRYFVTVAEKLSFRRAAEAHNISQPALSAQIRELERRLGFPLFTRTRHNVELTAQGTLFLDNARRIILETALIGRAAEEIRRDWLRVGIAHHMAGIPERNALVDRFLAARPDNRLRIHGRAPAQLYQELADGMIEVAINLEVGGSGASRSAVETGMADEFPRIVLGRRPVALAVPPGHALHGVDAVALSQLDGCRIGSLSRAHGVRLSEVIARGLRQAGAELVNLPEGDAPALIRYAPIFGIPVISLGWFAMPEEREGGRLKQVAVEGLGIETELVAIRSRRPARAAVDRFWDLMKEGAGDAAGALPQAGVTPVRPSGPNPPRPSP
ncbi:LysR family transcriptional regulator [Sphingobium indicum]